MPLNFPPNYIEQAVSGGVTQYSRRVDIYEADNSTLFARGVGLVDGSISVDMGRTERRTADLTLLNHDGRLDIDRDTGFWYDKVIRVVMGVRTSSGNWEASLGTFLPDRISSDNISSELKVTCRDFAKKLARKLQYDVAWPINHPIEDIIGDLAGGGGVGPAQRNLPVTGISTDEEKSFNQGSDRWGSMRDVATAHGYDLYFDVDGVLQMDLFTDPFTSPPQYTFMVGTFSNVSAIEREIADNLIVNHWVVNGEDIDGNPVWGEAFNDNPSSPTRIARLGYRTDVYNSAWVTTHTQAVEVAERRLKFSSLERYEAQLSAILVPWLDVNVTAEFDDPKAAPADPTRYLINELEIPLDLSAASVQLGRVTNIIQTGPIYPDIDVYPDTEGIFPGAP